MDSVPVRKPPCIFDKRLSEQVDIRLAQVEHVFLTLMWFLAAHMDRRSRRWRCIVRKFVDLPRFFKFVFRLGRISHGVRCIRCRVLQAMMRLAWLSWICVTLLAIF